jgi:hypothetical protein
MCLVLLRRIIYLPLLKSLLDGFKIEVVGYDWQGPSGSRKFQPIFNGGD